MQIIRHHCLYIYVKNALVVYAVAEASRNEKPILSAVNRDSCYTTHLDFETGKSAVLLFESMHFFNITVIFLGMNKVLG